MFLIIFKNISFNLEFQDYLFKTFLFIATLKVVEVNNFYLMKNIICYYQFFKVTKYEGLNVKKFVTV